jgi:hypothetical protein
MQSEIAKRERVMLRTIGYIGEQAVNQARSVDSYKDRTGNLRSSTGYVIVRDGQIVNTSSFEAVKGGQEGSSTGRSYAREVAGKFPKGIVLVVVAGMKYAWSVSRTKDVLDSAELLARRLISKFSRLSGMR